MSDQKAAFKPLKNTELSSFAGQMAMILKSGISAIEGLTILRDDAENPTDKKIYDTILNQMYETGSLWTALEETRLFPHYMVRMVQIGEQTGNLDTVMESMEAHYVREDEIQRTTTNSVLYPLLLTGIMIIVVLILMIRVMPVFNQVFKELGTEMTGFPLMLMNLGNAISRYSISFLLIIASILILVFVSNMTPEGKSFWHNFGRKFKRIRRGYLEIASCRFAKAMAMSLSSGLTPEQSLDLAAELNDDPDFATLLESVRFDVRNGESLTDSLYRHQVLSGLYARMASLGSKTGSLDQVLDQIGDLYQNDINARLNSKLSIVEPALVILLSVMVGAILLSVMFPLLGIMSSL